MKYKLTVYIQDDGEEIIRDIFETSNLYTKSGKIIEPILGIMNEALDKPGTRVEIITI